MWDIIFNHISKRVIQKTSGGILFNRRGFSTICRLIYGCGFFVLLGSEVQAGIKENVEKVIRNQFGDSISLSMEKLVLDNNNKSAVEKKVHQRFVNDFIYVWTIKDDDSVKAYGLLDNVKGLSMPITFLVIYDPDGKILDTGVVKYREPYGGEIASPSWTAQFKGRNAKSNYTVGSEIDGISGATISVYSMATGVMKLSLLFPLIKSQL